MFLAVANDQQVQQYGLHFNANTQNIIITGGTFIVSPFGVVLAILVIIIHTEPYQYQRSKDEYPCNSKAQLQSNLYWTARCT